MPYQPTDPSDLRFYVLKKIQLFKILNFLSHRIRHQVLLSYFGFACFCSSLFVWVDERPPACLLIHEERVMDQAS